MKVFSLIFGLALYIYGEWGKINADVLSSIRTNIYDFNKEEKMYLEVKQNFFRRQTDASNMMFMKWDDALAKKAERAVQRCNPDRVYKKFPVNIYKGKNGSVYSVLEKWSRPIFAIIEWAKPSEERSRCLQYGGSCEYVQMLVADSTKFGCSRKMCGNGPNESYVVVCRYEQKYDTRSYSYKTTDRCSDCGGNGSKCNTKYNLCMSREQCEGKYKGECVCRQQCNGGILDENECECLCPGCSNEEGWALPFLERPLRSGIDNPIPKIRSVIIAGLSLWIVKFRCF